MRQLVISTLFVLAACGSKSTPATEPAATPPAATGSATEPAATEPAATNQCTQQGGRCSNKMATNVCTRFEEGPAWGCGTNEGCCFN